MNQDKVNPYFYDDLKSFLQEGGRAKREEVQAETCIKVKKLRQKHLRKLEDLVLGEDFGEDHARANGSLNEVISSDSVFERMELMPHFIATTNWSTIFSVDLLDHYESVPESEMLTFLQGSGYDLSDFGVFIEKLQKLREKGGRGIDQSVSREDGINFRLSYLKKNQDSGVLFTAGLISARPSFLANRDNRRIVSKLARTIGLDDELTTILNQDSYLYGDLIFRKAENFHGRKGRFEGEKVRQYLRDELRIASDFFKDMDEVINNARYPELLRKLNGTTYNPYDSEPCLNSKNRLHLYQGVDNKKNYWLELLKAVDNETIAGYLTNNQNSNLFWNRIAEFTKFASSDSWGNINEYETIYSYGRPVKKIFFTEETFGDYVLEDLRNFCDVVTTIDNALLLTAESSQVRGVLEVERERVIERISENQKIEEDYVRLCREYFSILSSEEVETYLSGDNGDLFKKRISTYDGRVFYHKDLDVSSDNENKGIICDLRNLERIITTIDDVLLSTSEGSQVRKILERKKKSFLNKAVLEYKLDEKVIQSCDEYFSILSSEEVEGYLSGENGDFFKQRIGTYVKKIFGYHSSDSFSDINRVSEDLRAIQGIFTSIDGILLSTVEGSQVRKILEEEKRVLVKTLSEVAKIEAFHGGFLRQYFTALNDPEIAETVIDYDHQQKRKNRNFAHCLYTIDERLLVPLLREKMKCSPSEEKLEKLQNYFPNINRFEVEEEFVGLVLENPRFAMEIVSELAKIGADSAEALSGVKCGDYQFQDIKGLLDLLSNKGLVPTSYLITNLHHSENQTKTLDDWSEIIETFSDGNFDSEDELHRNLEYTRFRKVVEHEKIRRHVKNHFTFSDYESIFTRDSTGVDFSEGDKFEIKCAVSESKLLLQNILQMHEQAESMGKKIIVVPNFSYGYLPVAPIYDALVENGVEFILGSKVPSTKCHSSKEVFDSRFLKGKRTMIMDSQPIIVVVDGSNHILDREGGENKLARNPDAYIGISNHVIAINDALGFSEKTHPELENNYSSFGKDQNDLSRLRETDEFQRAVRVYGELIQSDLKDDSQPYLFGARNDLDKDLMIRFKHARIGEMPNLEVSDINQPYLILQVAGVTHDLIPDELREECPNDINVFNSRYKEEFYDLYGPCHVPAYFDDSGKIIDFDFGFDEFGVRYLNRLETELRNAYDRLDGRMKRSPESIPTPAIIQYAVRNPGRAQLEAEI